MKSLNKKIVLLAIVLAPALAFAQNGTQLYGIIGIFRNIVNLLIPIVLALIFLMIIWNGFKMVNSDGEDKAEYKQVLTKNIVIFFVVISIWGIVAFIGKTIGIEPRNGIITCPAGAYNPVTKACE